MPKSWGWWAEQKLDILADYLSGFTRASKRPGRVSGRIWRGRAAVAAPCAHYVPKFGTPGVLQGSASGVVALRVVL